MIPGTKIFEPDETLERELLRKEGTRRCFREQKFWTLVRWQMVSIEKGNAKDISGRIYFEKGEPRARATFCS